MTLQAQCFKQLQALCRDVLGEEFERQHNEGHDKETLLRVENMLLCLGCLRLDVHDVPMLPYVTHVKQTASLFY